MFSLYNVKIEKFSDKDVVDHVERFEVDLESCRNVLCVKYGDDFININDSEVYHLLKRKSNGTNIDSDEEIKLNKYYAISAQKCEMTIDDVVKSLDLEQKVKNIEMKGIKVAAKQ